MSQPARDESAIAQLIDDYVKLWNDRDPAACADLYHADGDLLAVDGEFLRGREDIRKYYEMVMSGKYATFQARGFRNLGPLRSLSPDVALLDSTWDIVNPSGEVVVSPIGSFVVSRAGNEWKIGACRVMVPVKFGEQTLLSTRRIQDIETFDNMKPPAEDSVRERGPVNVVTTATAPDRFDIVATAIFGAEPSEVWRLLRNWDQVVAVGLPGMTSDFTWLSGGPGKAPSTFQFMVADALLKEEIYELWEDAAAGAYRLRYRALEPALGVVEYDAVLDIQPVAELRTAFSATRKVRLAPDMGPETLAGMINSETQCLKDYFAQHS